MSRDHSSFQKTTPQPTPTAAHRLLASVHRRMVVAGYHPSYSLAVARLAPNEAVQVEAGSIVGMSAGMTLRTETKDGILKSLARSWEVEI